MRREICNNFKFPGRARGERALNRTLLFVITSTIAWTIFVMVSGVGIHLFGLSWNFQAVAELGEAFGVLAAVMASPWAKTIGGRV